MTLWPYSAFSPVFSRQNNKERASHKDTKALSFILGAFVSPCEALKKPCVWN